MKYFSLSFLLAFVFIVSSCNTDYRNRNSQIEKKENPNMAAQVAHVKPQLNPSINIYIENSGSMDGYLNGNFEFKDAISTFLTKLPFHYNPQNIKIYFINSRIDPVSTTQISLTSFSKNLNMYWGKGKQTRSDSTNLNNIFHKILAQTDNKTISILFSDCIYSVGQGDVVGMLSYEKNLTMSAFLQKYKRDKVPLATTIAKMSSKFNGKYFPFTGDDKQFHFYGYRPYYICVIANQEILNDFNKHIDLKDGKLEGYKNKYVLSSEDPKCFYYSVLLSTYNQGRFKADRNFSKKEYVHGIEDIDLKSIGGGCTRGNEEPLSFAVAVDFSQVQAEEDYLKNPANYLVTTDNFSVNSVIAIDKRKIKPNDWNRIATNNPTHIIILTAKTKAISDVSFVLKKQMPEWIKESNTEDDTDSTKLKGDKTFGLHYWVKGITEAYETIYPENKNFFECSISINK